MTTENENIVTDEDQTKKDNERFEELTKKEKKTEEEVTEVNDIKDRYGKRMQKKIDRMHYEKESEREAREKAEKERDDLKGRLDSLEKDSISEPAGNEDETREVAGKKYLTDNALMARIKSGKVTETDAYRYQRERDSFEIENRVYDRIKTEKKNETENEARKKDANEVLGKYPQFSKTSPQFNPQDPLYKEATRIYETGYASNPKGLSLAINDAKKILRMTDTQIDNTDDLSLESTGVPRKTRSKEPEVTLTDYEQEIAESQFTRGDVVNPKTGRAYTTIEAHSKALDAKKRRLDK